MTLRPNPPANALLGLNHAPPQRALPRLEHYLRDGSVQRWYRLSAAETIASAARPPPTRPKERGLEHVVLSLPPSRRLPLWLAMISSGNVLFVCVGTGTDPAAGVSGLIPVDL